MNDGPIRVLAIDPGYGRCGVALIDRPARGKKESLYYSNCIETPGTESFMERLTNVGLEIERLIKEHRPDHLAIEEVYFSTNQKTALHTAEVRGMILYVARKSDLSIFEYNPGRIKVALTGDGRATKEAVLMMVRRLITLPQREMRDDEIDAIAVGLTHLAEWRG